MHTATRNPPNRSEGHQALVDEFIRVTQTAQRTYPGRPPQDVVETMMSLGFEIIPPGTIPRPRRRQLQAELRLMDQRLLRDTPTQGAC